MSYGKTDELAINTIRTLAVCYLLRGCPTTLIDSYPAIAIFFLDAAPLTYCVVV